MKTQTALTLLAERALRGNVVELSEKDDVNFVADYIKRACFLGDAFADGTAFGDITKYTNLEETEIYGLSCSRVCGMPCINVLFRDKGKPFSVDSEDGVFCYVLNLIDSDCSEYGYSFFEKKGGSYHRIA